MEKLSRECERKLEIILKKKDPYTNIMNDMMSFFLKDKNKDEDDYDYDPVTGKEIRIPDAWLDYYWMNASNRADFEYLKKNKYISYEIDCNNFRQIPRITKIKVLYKGLTYFEKKEQENYEKKQEREFTIKTIVISNIITFILSIIANIILDKMLL